MNLLILVVDDEPQIRRIMRTELTSAGYEVDDAKTGEEALGKVREFRPGLVLLDIKSWDEERHRVLTGMDAGPTRDFARRLAARGRKAWLRFVLVPGLTDDPETIASIAGFAADLGNVERVDVLPFHQLGRYKWNRLAINYKLDGVQAASPDMVERACALFRKAGLIAH